MGLSRKQQAFVVKHRIAVDRFWSRVDQSGGPGACWPFMGARDPNGYGRFHVGVSRSSARTAHRIAYGLETGEEPPAVRHSCDNPPCCNPAHLLGGTRADNNRDMMERGRHASQTGSYTHPSGEAHHGAKLDAHKVQQIRTRYAVGDITQRQLAAEVGVCQRTINKVVREISYGLANA